MIPAMYWPVASSAQKDPTARTIVTAVISIWPGRIQKMSERRSTGPYW